MPKKPINKAVIAPITMTNDKAVSDSSNSGDILATIKMPSMGRLYMAITMEKIMRWTKENRVLSVDEVRKL
jgi:hypothetical protein